MKHLKKFESFRIDDLSDINEKKKSEDTKKTSAKKKSEKDCDDDDEKCETPKGLTKAQKKLPEGLRKAIEKKMKK
jgi:hypothetical protein